jgi:signal recognition particle GTPase
MSQDENAVNTEVEVQESTAPESASEETKTPEVADPILDELTSDEDKPTIVAETKEQPEEAEGEEESEPEETSEDTQETEAEEQPQGEEKPLSPKAENRFQQLANENKALREYIEKINAEVYKPQTTEELIDEGLSPELAEVRSLKQQLEVQEYNNRVVEAQTYLSQDSARVLSDFPIFDPDSPEYQEDIAASAAEALEKSLIIDPNTKQIIGSHLSPYQIYKPIADAYEKSKVAGQIQGQKATEKMLANAEPRPSATPKQSKKDPLLEILSSDD